MVISKKTMIFQDSRVGGGVSNIFRGGVNFSRGGGVELHIPIETYRRGWDMKY